ncbi:BTB/POZ domain-containing protein 6-B-like [Phlebotomus papatasi]|uniref:BTB/POZ domain-containing protein 6-B-like n=1 Tax=Phlebotomus papatasi TaxID=29031 RepID=UPI00248465A5|nr:BTB/POZ domain-containing protein 6-B-like [Phlebotomus papatasi]
MASTSSTNSVAINSVEFGQNPDVKFLFPNNGGATLLAEKVELANKSEVFKNQFSCDITDNGGRESIPITDISFDTFSKMISHIYGTKIAIDKANFREILYVSRKYFLDDLTVLVIEFLKQFLNADNLAEHFEFIEKFDIKMLNDYMAYHCRKFPLTVINTLTISAPHKRILHIILKSPIISCTEYDLYQAVVTMLIRQQKNKVFDEEIFKKELGKMIYLIRFPTMTVSQLISCGTKPSLLSEKQLVDLLLWVQDKKFSTTLQFFSNVQRFNENILNLKDMCLKCRATNIYCKKCDRSF